MQKNKGDIQGRYLVKRYCQIYYEKIWEHKRKHNIQIP